jgi:hypothetical protein
MSDDRVRALLAHATIVDALHEDDIAEVLSDVASLSEQYIPTLQFLMRPDNRTFRSSPSAFLPCSCTNANTLRYVCHSRWLDQVHATSTSIRQ